MQAKKIQEHEETSLYSSLVLIFPELSSILGNMNTQSDLTESFLRSSYVL